MKRFLALGDSYTIGEGVSQTDRWTSLLVELLREHGVSIAEPQIVARTAWTSDELADAIAAAPPAGPFDLVTLMVGVNDQYRGRDLQQFRGHFEPLLRTALGFAGDRPTHLVLISIPDWGHTPFAAHRDRALISAGIDAYNAWLADRARTGGARWVDVTSHSRSMADDPTLVAPDGLHPSARMHRLWADAIAPVARLALGERAATAVPGGARGRA